MGRKGVYPKNFGTPHSKGTLINGVTAPLFFFPMAVLIGFALGGVWVGLIVIVIGIKWMVYEYKNNPDWKMPTRL